MEFRYLGKIKRMMFKFLTFGFGHNLCDELDSLHKKMNIYFKLFPKQKKKYIKEITFINTKADSNIDYSYILPYHFIYDYNIDDIEVYKDELLDLFYVFHQGKKLYYSRDYKNVTEVKKSYHSIILEQDVHSPHKYTSLDFDISNNDIVIDIGGAEGNFSLEIVEKVSKLYIFEIEEHWMEALKATFEPWIHKVTLVNKYVSNINSGNSVSLDELFSNSKVDFIKIDVEGAEMKILAGAKNTLKKNKDLKLAICTYHKQRDAINISRMLIKNNFHCSFTDGYILFIYSYLAPPYFRKGLVRAQKSNGKALSESDQPNTSHVGFNRMPR